jgi:hypothetical protein
MRLAGVLESSRGGFAESNRRSLTESTHLTVSVTGV